MGLKDHDQLFVYQKKKKMINYLLQDMWIDSHICQAPCMLMFSREKMWLYYSTLYCENLF